MGLLLVVKPRALRGRYDLVTLRSQIDKSWQDEEEWSNYFAVIMQHKAILYQTTINIKKMVELGAAVDVQDIFGKTVLDYCMTKEIYDVLIGVGVPFQIDAWIYFNYDYFVKKAPIIAPILGACLCIAVYKTMNQGKISMDEKDAWIQQMGRYCLR